MAATDGREAAGPVPSAGEGKPERRLGRADGCAADAGFTLIETLVALAIVGVCLTTAIAIVGQGWSQMTASETRFRATFDAEQLLARLELGDMAALAGATGTLPDGASYHIGVAPYPWPADSQEHPISQRRGELRQVVVTVSPSGLDEDVVLQTLVTVPRGLP